MKAVTYNSFGSPLSVLTYSDIEQPEPKANEVLVKLHFSGVNPSDAKARSGGRPGVSSPPYDTIIPHSDGSGIIVGIGENISSERHNERVWIWNGGWNRAFGTAAEYICLPAEQAVKMPPCMSFEHGACLGIPGLTAAQLICTQSKIEGKTIFISGGSGAVGHLAIQLAKYRGARVITTARPGRNNRLKDLGADFVLDYNDDKLDQKVLECAPRGVDLAVEVEFGKNIGMIPKIMRPMGTVFIYGSGKNMTPQFPFGEYLFKSLKLNLVLVYLMPMRLRKKLINVLHDAYVNNALAPSIDIIYDFSECAKAHERVMKPGRNGAVLLKID